MRNEPKGLPVSVIITREVIPPGSLVAEDLEGLIDRAKEIVGVVWNECA